MTMHIHNHRLYLGGQVVSMTGTPNVSSGRLKPRYLVLHYTASPTMQSAISWFANPRARASAHLVVGRSGDVVQIAPFDRVTWHAGRSRWRGLTGLNRHAIGIELENAGPLERKGGSWRAWFGGCYDDEDVMQDCASRSRAWHLYTPVQIDVVTAIAERLVEHYGLLDVIGHADIAPGRKLDPGPAFPLATVRDRAIGQREEQLDLYETTTRLNIRSGANTTYACLPGSPLASGTRLHVLEDASRWCYVEVLDKHGVPDQCGWVHGDYIRACDMPAQTPR